MLKLARVIVKSIMGITSCDFVPGQKLTWVRAQNAGGKTSLTTALAAAVGGGTDVRIVRNGEESGEIALLLEDVKRPARNMNIRRTIRADGKGSKAPVVSTPDVPRMPAPQEVIESLIDLRSTNPLNFLKLGDRKEDREKRAEWLLGSIPMSLSMEELTEASGLGEDSIEALGLPKLHPLEALRKIEKLLTEKRADHNGRAEEKEATVKTLAASAPALPAGVISEASVESERGKLADITSKIDRAKQSIATARDGLLEKNRQTKSKLLADAVKVRDAAIKAANDAYEVSLNELTAKASDADGAIRRDASAQAQDVDKAYAAELSAQTIVIDRLERALQDLGKYQESQKQQKRFSGEASDLRRIAKAADERIQGLETIRKRLMAENPLPDTELIDGEIFVASVPWEKVNEAMRMDVAIRCAELRAGVVGIIVVDGIERMTDTSQRAFVERALTSPCQYIVTEPVDMPFDVSPVDSVEQFEEIKEDNNRRRQAAADRRKKGESSNLLEMK